MTGLLAAERPVAALELGRDAAVADRRGRDLDPLRLHRLVEAIVAHHGHRDAAVEHAATPQVCGDERDQLVAVANRAGRVDREHAVAVAVEREPEPGAGGHDPLGERFRVR